MMRRGPMTAAVLAALFMFAPSPASAQADPDVFVSTGPTGEILLGELGASGWNFSQLFTTGGGFKPEEIALAGDGNLYICDASNSEIFRLTSNGLVTIYDRNSANSDNPPEQPKGCTIAGDDLLFLSRNGNGQNAKTGLWAIRNITSANPSEPVNVLGLDAVGGAGGQGLAVNFDGRIFFTFGTEIWVATPAPNSGGVGPDATFEVWASTVAEGFGIATKGFPDPVTQSLQTQVFVAAKFSGVIEVLEEIAPGVGSSDFCSVIDVDHMPNSLEFDGSGDLWVAASAQSNGRRGSVYEVESPACGAGQFTVVPRGADLSGAVGLALTPTGSAPITLTAADFTDGKSSIVNLCNSTFNLDEVLGDCQDEWTISCRFVSQDEFTQRVFGTPFAFTTYVDFPGASGNGTEIRITQDVQNPLCTEKEIIDILANWQFYSLTALDHPGLLYSPGDFVIENGEPAPENNPFTENILVDFDPLPIPTDPLDPRATGSRDAWGSGIMVVDGAPNRPPTAVLTVTPTVAQCNEPITLNGLGSFDNDWNVDHADSITRFVFGIDDEDLASPVQDGLLWEYTASGLATGGHTASLQVYDEGWQASPAEPLASEIVDVPFTVEEAAPPSFSQPPTFVSAGSQATIETGTFATMWPPNHELVPFVIDYVVQGGDCDFECNIIVSSNEPENGTGDGDIAPDWVITGEKTFELRSERAQNQSGRTYTITVECTDTVGNVTVSDPIRVFVPSSQ